MRLCLSFPFSSRTGRTSPFSCVSALLYPTLILIFGFVTPPLPTALADRILFLLPIASKSHVHVFEPLARALAQRGHDIVFMSPVKYSDMPGNIQQMQILSVEEIFGSVANHFETRKLGTVRALLNNSFSPLMSKCGKVLQSSEFQRLVTEEQFDLVIIDILMSYCAAGAIPILKAPSILITCFPAPPILTNDFGNRLLPSFIVDPLLHLPHQMSFLQRVGNTLFGLGMYFGSLYGFAYPSEKLYRQSLPNGESLPDIHSIQRNASMIFSNSHWSLNHPRPLLPDVIEVGGMHTRPAKTLPKDIAKFLKESGTDGFIFFSLGSNVKGNAMPKEYREIFARVFSKLKQRVLWKWEDDSMKDRTSSNVLLRKWLPQQDVLGHPNIKLFISHGGLLSTQEAAYHGVPMLAIPIMGDQDLNAKRVEAAGLAKSFEILTMTDESLEKAILEMLKNPMYTQKSKEMSILLHDLPQTPLETAVFWSEYVMRHKGAPHLKSYARELNFFQYYILDVVAFLTVIIIAAVLTLRALCKCLCCRGSSDKNVAKEKIQ